MSAKHQLEHEVWKKIKEYELIQSQFVVSLSGGLDSVALLVLLKSAIGEKLSAFYFHHGENENLDYRNQALVFNQNLCRQLDVDFYSAKNSDFVKSEAGLREKRYQALLDFKQEHSFDVIALGHHRDDLLETRLLRLIRGTGGQGLVAMKEWSMPYFRPLLEISKKQLREYLAFKGVEYIEDPSNQITDPLRNWLREAWLKPLARKQKGSIDSLARSLETISQELSSENEFQLLLKNNQVTEIGISRVFYLSLNTRDQLRLLAQYVLQQNLRDISQSQLREIQKRLDNSQNEYTFNVGHVLWVVNAQHVKVQ